LLEDEIVISEVSQSTTAQWLLCFLFYFNVNDAFSSLCMNQIIQNNHFSELLLIFKINIGLIFILSVILS